MKRVLFAFMKYYSKGQINSFFVFLEAIMVLLIPVILIALSIYFYLEKIFDLDLWLMNTEDIRVLGRFKAMIIFLILLIPTIIFSYRLRISILGELNTYLDIPDKNLSRLRLNHYILCAAAFGILIATIFSIY